ncbi:MAG: SRPBCC family protein [Bacteroidota bacterium]
MHHFIRKQVLKIDKETAWEFFSSPLNLAKITPSYLDFKITNEISSEEIYDGMFIEYTIKPLFGIPVKWKTKISNVSKYLCFTDNQISGPYKSWVHTHYFIQQENQILIVDEIYYELKLGKLGKLINSLYIKKKINAIFDYRMEVLEDLF